MAVRAFDGDGDGFDGYAGGVRVVLAERGADPGVIGPLHLEQVSELFKGGPLFLAFGIHRDTEGVPRGKAGGGGD
ncbi:MAG: hypothetical protein AMXMBFR80_01670 [Dehalococcoidia bacterium]